MKISKSLLLARQGEEKAAAPARCPWGRRQLKGVIASVATRMFVGRAAKACCLSEARSFKHWSPPAVDVVQGKRARYEKLLCGYSRASLELRRGARLNDL